MAIEHTPQQQAVLERLAVIRRNLETACQHANRPIDDVHLMAVTKTVDPVLINTAVAAGVHLLGENRVQEYYAKRDAYAPEAEVQFIGHLQSNKVKQLVGEVTLIHSVDRISLATEIQHVAAQRQLIQPVLLEVNIGGELSKSGVAPDALPALLEQVLAMPNLRVDGLMTIPPPIAQPGDSERHFDAMANLFAAMQTVTPMTVLSMGMSEDYEQAIAYGATIVRLGRALFGPRQYPAAI